MHRRGKPGGKSLTQFTLHIVKQMQCTLCTTKVNSRPISTPSRRRRLWLIAIANADCLATLIRSTAYTSSNAVEAEAKPNMMLSLTLELVVEVE